MNNMQMGSLMKTARRGPSLPRPKPLRTHKPTLCRINLSNRDVGKPLNIINTYICHLCWVLKYYDCVQLGRDEHTSSVTFGMCRNIEFRCIFSWREAYRSTWKWWVAVSGLFYYIYNNPQEYLCCGTFLRFD